ncbi:MAG: hypothetical protein IKF75_01735 [Lachnospiraceae bacterium]|nr:hypothetical protein [Lachnospiraceae bacterium]
MPTIDTENAKQIRQPMQVEISVALADPGNPLTYSGYAATAKVADGVLGQRSWPMRQLADLQGDGFPLDGSRELYETKTASQANGKLGVRGHVGQDADVTISRSRTIPSVEIRASGASAVVYGGTAYSLETGSANVLIGATSATLTFVPKDATVRAEVEYIGSTTEFVIRNDTLIRAVVSLRSDLSLYGQTLPESEINIEAFVSTDVSDYIAAVAEDTPITYRAGYDSDLSDGRDFYVSGQITWADNILTIHAVDAVHFLDSIEMPAPVTENDSEFFFNAVRYFLERAGISARNQWATGWWYSADTYRWIIPKGVKARDHIAFMNQCFKLTDDNAKLIDGSATLGDELQFDYVDAGIPTLRTRYFEHNVYWDINEEDCAEVKKNIERPFSKATAKWERITNPTMPTTEAYVTKVGTATLTKNVGTMLQFDEYAFLWLIGLWLGSNSDNDIAQKLSNAYGMVYGAWRTMPVVPPAKDATQFGDGRFITSPVYIGRKLMIGGLSQEEANGEPPTSIDSYASFVPWSQPYNGWRYDGDASHTITTASKMWSVLAAANIVGANDSVIDLDIRGAALNLEDQSLSYSKAGEGRTFDFGDAPIIGKIAVKRSNNNAIQIYPQKMMMAPMYRSQITGSFTWKGDPRMQPRDRCRFTRLDGTVEEITLENITITHEGGGTSAEITYRKGYI